MYKEKLTVAASLGYYARATDPQAIPIARAVEIYAPAYRNDIDCQIAFRKGYHQAEEDAKSRIYGAHEVRQLAESVRELMEEVKQAQRELITWQSNVINIALSQRVAQRLSDLPTRIDPIE